MRAAILCGGLGTRLQARLPGKPKALAPIGDGVFLDYVLRLLRRFGVEEAILCTGYKGEAIREHVGGGKEVAMRVRYSEEKEALGTGGAVKNAQGLLSGGPFFICNGDTLLDVDFGRLLAAHRRAKAIATLALARVQDGSRYGNVQTVADGEVKEWVEKPESGKGGAGTAWIYGGICVAEPRLFELIPAAPPAVSLERDVFRKLAGHGLFAERFPGFFLDIGVPEDYERARKVIPERYGCDGAHSG